VVYDADQGLCWLADANLAGDPDVRAQMNVSGINSNGTMDWETALHWVDALNGFDNGRGFLGHNNWQLPVTPNDDDTCSSSNNGSFGVSCTGSALGHLYSAGLGLTFPDSVVPNFVNKVGPFHDLVPSLYWAGGSDGGGDGVLLYTSGVAAGKAVYDSRTGVSWPIDANLASREMFGIKGTTTITSDVNGTVVTVPLIDADGAMLFETASQPGGWLYAMNADELRRIQRLATARRRGSQGVVPGHRSRCREHAVRLP
jgi:hypothetical protein